MTVWSQRITAIACDGGGVNIEETARNEPKRIVREAVDPAVGMLDFQCRKVATHLGLGDKQLSVAVKLMQALYRCFRDNDALLIEINPLALTRKADCSRWTRRWNSTATPSIVNRR